MVVPNAGAIETASQRRVPNAGARSKRLAAWLKEASSRLSPDDQSLVFHLISKLHCAKMAGSTQWASRQALCEVAKVLWRGVFSEGLTAHTKWLFDFADCLPPETWPCWEHAIEVCQEKKAGRGPQSLHSTHVTVTSAAGNQNQQLPVFPTRRAALFEPGLHKRLRGSLKQHTQWRNQTLQPQSLLDGLPEHADVTVPRLSCDWQTAAEDRETGNLHEPPCDLEVAPPAAKCTARNLLRRQLSQQPGLNSTDLQTVVGECDEFMGMVEHKLPVVGAMLQKKREPPPEQPLVRNPVEDTEISETLSALECLGALLENDNNTKTTKKHILA